MSAAKPTAPNLRAESEPRWFPWALSLIALSPAHDPPRANRVPTLRRCTPSPRTLHHAPNASSRVSPVIPALPSLVHHRGCAEAFPLSLKHPQAHHPRCARAAFLPRAHRPGCAKRVRKGFPLRLRTRFICALRFLPAHAPPRAKRVPTLHRCPPSPPPPPPPPPPFLLLFSTLPPALPITQVLTPLPPLPFDPKSMTDKK